MPDVKRKEDYIDVSKYYDYERILSQKDSEGLVPSTYMIDTNRGDGKTTSFLIDALLRFYNNSYETVYLFREKQECKMVPYMFEDVFNTYPELSGEFKREEIADGIIQRYTLNGKPFALGVCLKDEDKIKGISGLFFNATRAIFEEFQTESGKYLTNEAVKLQSIFTSMNRGGGKRDRNMKLIMLGNHISLLNPHYVMRGIHKKWNPSQRYYRGKGWVTEIHYNQSAAEEIQNSAMFRSFVDENGSNRYGNMISGDNYLFEAGTFIEQPVGRSHYLCTLKHNNEYFGVWEYYQQGVLYVSRKTAKYDQVIITFNAGDHSTNTMMLNRYSFQFKLFKKAFEGGYLYFEDDRSKIAIFDILGLTLYQ